MGLFKTLSLIFLLGYNFLFPNEAAIKSQDQRVNILILGKAGGVHEGPDLTDTIMVVSLSLVEKSVNIISIPRDTWIPEIRAKLNSAYHYGGVVMAKDSVERVLGLPIHYYAIVDFSLFKEIVDTLGGIEVDVVNSFVDKDYPIAGRENDLCDGDKLLRCRYETVTFNKGLQKMDGETALKFVRSRHAEGDEGTDTARSARQQKVIEAIRNKIMDKGTYLNIRKDVAILNAILDSLETDIDNKTAGILARKFFDSKDSVKSYLIPDNLLTNPPISKTYDNQYVFIPKLGNGKWNEIQSWVKSVVN